MTALKKESKPKKHRHIWEFIAESTQSVNNWCTECGAWKRTPTDGEKETIFLPSKVKYYLKTMKMKNSGLHRLVSVYNPLNG